MATHSSPFWQRYETLQELYAGQWLQEVPDAREELAELVTHFVDLGGWSAYWMVSLLIGLFKGSDAGGQDERNDSPAAYQYDPQKVTFHYATHEFENLLYQIAPRSAITFLWTTWNGQGTEDSFEVAGNKTRIGVFLHKHAWYEAEGEYYPFNGGVIGFIRRDELEIYPLPPNWQEILRRVRATIRHMSAQQKARKEVSFTLKHYVDLLGFDTVYDALEKLNPAPASDSR